MKQKSPLKYLFFIVSLLFSVIPLLIRYSSLHPKKKKPEEKVAPDKWRGLWIGDNCKMLLEMNDRSNIVLDNQPLQLTLQEALDDRLTFRDKYGYRITMKKTDTHLLQLFDEAEEKEHTFIRIGK